jgi:hypothetical protein
LAIILTFLRPTGILIVLPVLLDHLDFKRLQMLIFVILPVVILTVPILPKDQLQGIAQNHVILGNPENPEINQAANLNNLWDVQNLVIKDHGWQKWFSLFTGRILSLFNPMRDWFSLSHNLLVSPLFLVYFFAFRAVFLDTKNRKLITLIIAIAINAILVGFTYDEWDARFLSSMIPMILLLSGLGLASFFKINTRFLKTD